MYLTEDLIKQLNNYFNLVFKLKSDIIPYHLHKEYSEFVFNNIIKFCKKHEHKFDPNKGKAIGYFACVVRNYSMTERIRITKNISQRQEIIQKLTQIHRQKNLDLVLC